MDGAYGEFADARFFISSRMEKLRSFDWPTSKEDAPRAAKKRNHSAKRRKGQFLATSTSLGAIIGKTFVCASKHAAFCTQASSRPIDSNK